MPAVIERKPVVDVSLERLNTLHPLIREDAIAAYKEAVRITPAGVHPFINEALRSSATQAHYYKLGRTERNPDGASKNKPMGDIITWAKPGQGYHEYGLAIDGLLLINGKEVWTTDKNWMLVVKCFKAFGFEWGGDWPKNKQDFPHFQKTLGYKWKTLLALKNAGKVDANGYVIINANQ